MVSLPTHLQIVEHPRAEVSGDVILEHHLDPLAPSEVTRDETHHDQDFPDPHHGETKQITAKSPQSALSVVVFLLSNCGQL